MTIGHRDVVPSSIVEFTASCAVVMEFRLQLYKAFATNHWYDTSLKCVAVFLASGLSNSVALFAS